METLLSDLPFRMIGTAGGVIVALAMSNDAKTWQGLRRRFYVSLVFGLLLADPVSDYLGWDMTIPRRTVMASCISAALGWWVMHAIIRITRLYKGPG